MLARPLAAVLLTLVLALLIAACGDDGPSKEDHFNAGVDLAAQGLLEEAVLEFDQAIGLDLSYTEAYTNRGGVYLDLGRPQLAITDSNKAIELDPDNALAYANRGGAYGPELPT
jgi:tetratricopeptide (TPR) repeat protein